MSAFNSVIVHQSLRAEAQAGRRLESLLTGKIQHGLHYQSPRQAQLWLEVHRRHAPLFADSSFTDIFRAIAGQTALRLKTQAVHVIGLGAGGGEKEAMLLQALQSVGCTVRYTPLDVSLELALISAEAARPFVSAEILPIVGDLSLLPALAAWLDRYPPREARVFTAFGLTPNSLPGELLGWLAAALRPQDLLLLSANLAPVDEGETNDLAAYRKACLAILPQYDNLETRRWLRQILLDWGIAEHLSEPVFSVQPFASLLGFVAECRWRATINLDWEGQTLSFAQGDALRLFFSLRYTPSRLASCLAEHGLALGSGQVTACGQEGVWLAAKAGAGFGGTTGTFITSPIL